jgi:hypothetical protein
MVNKILSLPPSLPLLTPPSLPTSSSFKNIFKTNKLLRIEKYPYRILEVIVDNRMKDKSYTDLVNIIHSTMKDIKKRIVTNKDGIVYTKCQPICFEILYSSSKEITFNFAINELDSLYFKNRLQTILPNATLTFRDDYIDEFKDSSVYKYEYNKHYMLSLNTKLSPIQSLLAIKKDLNDNEKILLQTMILPIDSGWKDGCYNNWTKMRKGCDVTNNNFLIALLDGVSDFINGCVSILDDIIEISPKSEKSTFTTAKKLMNEFSSESRTKTNYDGYKVAINSYIKTNDVLQNYNLAKSIETCYKDITLDNEIVMGKKKTVKKLERKISLINRNIVSSEELATLLKLPDNAMQKRFNLRNIRINQVDIPEECNKGNLNLGHVVYHGDIKEWYMPLDKNIGCLPLILLTKMGGGKTTLLLNMANGAVKNGEGLVLFDYVKDCQTASALIKMFPDIQIIRFDDIDSLDNFSFPEISIEDTDTPFDKKLKANMIATEVKYLINSMAQDSENMSRIMSKYLVSACKVIFVHKNRNLKDVLDVLENKDIRERFIKKSIDDGLFNKDSREIVTLRELNKETNFQRIQGLLDRFSIITEDTLFCEMLDKINDDDNYEEIAINGNGLINEEFLGKVSNNINFVDIMDNQKPVVIMMPQSIFTNRLQKDILCTYYMSRIRLAMSRRKDVDKICRVIIDEVHQIPQTMNLIKDTIAEPRKFGLSYIMAMHSFSQVKKELKDILLDIGCHFMLLKGVSESGFNELKPYIGDEFEYPDMKEMDYDYGSLNLINIKNQHRVFMSELPMPLKDKSGKLYIG